jgi:hypothetical protein
MRGEPAPTFATGWQGKKPWFKVGDQVRPTTLFCGQRPLCTITEITERGFKYTHAPIVTGSPSFFGEYRGGETYVPSEYELSSEKASGDKT